MKRSAWTNKGGLMAGLVAAVVWLWSVGPAQAQQREAVAFMTSPLASVDGRSGAAVKMGEYRLVSVVGQPVSGRRALGQAGVWAAQRRGQASLGALEAAGVPEAFALSANYPNPFNPQTTISFALPAASVVELVVFDVLGREVRRLVDRTMEAGRHEVVFEAGSLPSGVYLYRMVAGSFVHQRTMLLVK